MFNPDLQYRCTIIRGKAQTDLDNLLPAYANIVSEICPCPKNQFIKQFDDELSKIIYNIGYETLDENHQKTIRNHRTEIAGKLFGLYYCQDGVIFESESSRKLLSDNDQPAFFKNLCLNFQFPNVSQKILTTLKDRIINKIKLKPFHFVIALLFDAQQRGVSLTKAEIGYYALGSLEVLQGKVTPSVVLDAILEDRRKGKKKQLKGSRDNQHITEQFNLLELANLVKIDKESISLNLAERKTLDLFMSKLYTPLSFDVYSYDLNSGTDRIKLQNDWDRYYGNIAVNDYSIIETSIAALQGETNLIEPIVKTKGTNHTILGDEGEEFVYQLELARVKRTHPRLLNKVLPFGSQRGLGYDISSVEADEDQEDPEFDRYIEVKSTKRITEPDLLDASWTDTINLTRKEWIAAKQHRQRYNIYRVYFTPNSTVVRKINDPFQKNESGIITVLPTLYRMDFGSSSIDKQY